MSSELVNTHQPHSISQLGWSWFMQQRVTSMHAPAAASGEVIAVRHAVRAAIHKADTQLPQIHLHLV